jgi:hypothetical protein
MRQLFQNFAGRFRRDHEPLSDEVVKGFLRILERARIDDVPCSEVYSRLDEYVEKDAHGHAAARLMPLLREHLDCCHDCSEEYEALMRVLGQASSEG